MCCHAHRLSIQQLSCNSLCEALFVQAHGQIEHMLGIPRATHGSPSARTVLTVPTGDDGPSSVEIRRRLQFSPQSLYNVVLVVQFSSRPLYDVTILQISYKGSGYHYLPLCFFRSDDLSVSRRSSLPWLINNNTSSLGKPTILSSIYTHSIRLTTCYRNITFVSFRPISTQTSPSPPGQHKQAEATTRVALLQSRSNGCKSRPVCSVLSTGRWFVQPHGHNTVDDFTLVSFEPKSAQVHLVGTSSWS
jgi:hypothetical protein